MMLFSSAGTGASSTDLRSAGTYEQWAGIAASRDREEGLDEWKENDVSELYDYVFVRQCLNDLRKFRNAGAFRELMDTLNEALQCDLGGICKSSLYNRTLFGTKRLINDFVQEVCTCLRYLAETEIPGFPIHEKQEFFFRMSRCCGRTALMLSGGAVLGFFHAGVLKALFDQNLLPRVISGSSAGSILAAVVCTHSDEELRHRLTIDNLYQEAEKTYSIRPEISLAPSHRSPMDARKLRNYIAKVIPDMTFLEAREMTGRSLNITVTGFLPHQKSRLLNAVTAPNVYIRSAVMASCAIYGIYPPVTLTCKNAHGERSHYLPDMQWIDGSFVDDLPALRLSRLYGVNRFISSMTNPAALAMTPNPDADNTFAGRIYNYYIRQMKRMATEALKLSRDHLRIQSPAISLMQHLSYSILAQEYTADINIFLRNRWDHPFHLLDAPSKNDMMHLIREGELSAWEKVEMVRNCTAVSRMLEEILITRNCGESIL